MIFNRKHNPLWLSAILFWTIIISLFFWNEVSGHKEQIVNLAAVEAAASFNKDLVYRRWAAGHGGLYVPVTETTPPNDHLQHVPERDIETPSGRKLTLVNPAYMTRQVHELAAGQYGVQGHITSLNPLRKENTPDDWEAKALQSFHAGGKKVREVVNIDGQPYLRIMFSLTTEERCLKCHAIQGYATGDIRGGISTSVPLEPYFDIYNQAFPKRSFYYGLVWLIGTSGLLVASKKIRHRTMLLEKALLESEKIQLSLVESEDRFQKLFRNNCAVMLLLNPDTSAIEDANDSACSFYGYSSDQFKSLKINDLNLLPSNEISTALQQVVSGKEKYFEFQHRLSSSEVREVEVHASPIKVGHKFFVLSIIHDITDRKKLMEEQSRSAQLAALGTVAAGVAHEINNPINGIINCAELLKSRADDRERTLDIARRIATESERIANITKNLLHYSKNNREEMKPVDSKELIESALSLIAPRIKPTNIAVETELTDYVSPIVVNPQSIQQVIINLVNNAFDALRDKKMTDRNKTIKIRSYLDKGDTQSQLCIEVSDNGIGMTSDVVKKARDAFFSTKPSTEGTGLGLSIVSEIIAKHKGTMEIDSKEGSYTKITVKLPV